MEADASSAVEAARVIESQLDSVLTRLRACRTEPLDAAIISQLISLRFEATRLARRHRLLHPSTSSAISLECLDPAARLSGELKDVRSEAVRRGVRLTLELERLAQVTRERKAIDVLACLVEDGVEAGATFLSMEIRSRDSATELCLTTDAALHHASFGVLMLGTLARPRSNSRLDALSVQFAKSAAGLTTISLHTPTGVRNLSGNHGVKRWTSLSPSRI